MPKTLKRPEAPRIPEQKKIPKLEIVLKCDSAGSVEAVTRSLAALSTPAVQVSVIRSSIGAVSKSDVLFAETASRLIIGFQVGVMHGLDKTVREHRVEVRLYEIIYRLTEDVRAIVESLVPRAPEEQIVGSGRIIALFKSSRKGIIIGCEVQEGFLAVGERFRIISVMGPVYTGTIDSLHIGTAEVKKAVPRQQVGIRIKDFKGAKVGDLVESFRPPAQEKVRGWQPSGQIIRK